MRRGFVSFLAVVLVLGLFGTAAYLVTRGGHNDAALPQECTARVGADSITLSPEQAANASVIAAVGQRRGLPARAVSIAITAAIQESKLFNLHYGDSDSLGLFQQRPSQGWGRKQQVLNPVYASNAFYDALERVSGYQTMDIGKAAQAVQRSAYPEAYDEHETVGRALASALTGWSPAAFSCRVDAPQVSTSTGLVDGLSTPAIAVRSAARTMFGAVASAAVGPSATLARASGASMLVAAREGRVLTLRPPHANAPVSVAAWGLASYLVAHAHALHVAQVQVGGRVWVAANQASHGWRPAPAGTATTLGAGAVAVVVA